MQNATGGGVAPRSDDRDAIFNAIVTDLAGLISLVDGCIQLVDSAIVKEAASRGHETANVIILDDVTPCYSHTRVALGNCNRCLGAALNFLHDAEPDHSSGSHLLVRAC